MAQARSSASTPQRGKANPLAKSPLLKASKNAAPARISAPELDKGPEEQSPSTSETASTGSEIEMQSFIIQSLDIASNEEMQNAVRDLAEEELNKITSKELEVVVIPEAMVDSNAEVVIFSDASDLELRMDTEAMQTMSPIVPQFTLTISNFVREVMLVFLWTLFLALATIAKVKMEGISVGPPPT